MAINRVTVAGGGVLGSQIAYQAAYKGFEVTLWLRSEGSIERAEPKLQRLQGVYTQALQAMKEDPVAYCRGLADSPELSDADIDALIAQADDARGRMTLTTDKEAAFGDADMVIEAIAERLDEKKAFYGSIADLLPEDTVLCSNSSTLMPSQMMDLTGRPDRFLCLHFANDIYRNNTAEVMGSAETSLETYAETVAFARALGMVPLELHREQPGYLLNSMLVPFLNAAQALLATDVADAETIDAAWKLGTGAPLGPFQILDVVGITTAYNIVSAAPGADDPSTVTHQVAVMLKGMIDEGKTGIHAGEGFYKYDE